MPSRILGFQFPLSSFRLYPWLLPSSQGFGYMSEVHVPKLDCFKLDPKALNYIFLGYAPNHKGYKCYHPSFRKRFAFMDITFHEFVSFFSPSQPNLKGEKRCEREDEVLFLFSSSLSL